MGTLMTRELTEADWDHWDDWLAQQPWGSPFSSAWWLDANCRAFGGHPLLLGVFDGEELVGGVALRVRDAGFVHMTGFPILYDPIVMAATGAQRRQEVLGVLLDEMVRQRLIVPTLDCTPDVVDLREAVWHHWDLTAGWTVVTALKTWTLEDAVSRAELKQMRKAQRAEVTARIEPRDADVLYDLMEITMLRQNTKLHQSRRQLRILLEGIGVHGMQVVARDSKGVALSAGLVMSHGGRVAFDTWAGTSRIGLASGAAVARYVLLLKELQTRGYDYFDWCGANLPGVSDFKLEFGGILTTRLTISRQPLWFKAVFAGYHHAKRIRGFLKRDEHDRKG